VRFQGFHGGHLLVIVDEARGLRGEIWEAIEGARAGGEVHVVALGNPTTAGGVFYDAFTNNRANWKTFTIDAFATPNLDGSTEAATDPADDLEARLMAQATKLVEGHRAGHSIDIDPSNYRSYVRPRLCASSDPDAAALVRRLDQRFGMA
jgi:hypothetical protein